MRCLAVDGFRVVSLVKIIIILFIFIFFCWFVGGRGGGRFSCLRVLSVNLSVFSVAL